jgi:hypothetical protein
MPSPRFPPPWTVEEYRDISYIVRDANNFAVAHVYFASEQRGHTRHLMTKDEARIIAATIARVPEMVMRSQLPPMMRTMRDRRDQGHRAAE